MYRSSFDKTSEATVENEDLEPIRRKQHIQSERTLKQGDEQEVLRFIEKKLKTLKFLGKPRYQQHKMIQGSMQSPDEIYWSDSSLTDDEWPTREECKHSNVLQSPVLLSTKTT